MRIKSVACALVAAALASQLAACGTVFYPERRGQISGQIDPGVAILNGIGLLFYLVPGVIAFAVDFATGAIYLPDARYSIAPEKLHKTVGPDGQVDAARLKTLIHQETGVELPLEQAQQLNRPGAEQLAALGLPPRA
ncbi:polyribonucleotide nucleotidyltransferase [Halopseudomonas sp.]|uniref:polyribonucleotide nucleotidyltransferase n=1 Tax=Halopseudomonas sp. TaxID=2901191 RepID=UPI003565B2EF